MKVYRASCSVGQNCHSEAGFALLGVGLEESNEVCALLWLLQSGENHFRAGDVLLWVNQIFK